MNVFGDSQPELPLSVEQNKYTIFQHLVKDKIIQYPGAFDIIDAD